MPPQNREAVAGKPGRSPPWRQAPCLASSRFLVFIFPVCGAPGRVALPLVRPLTCPYLHRFPVFPIPHAYPTPEFAHDRYPEEDRKSTRLNSSHPSISYAVFCLKKKRHNQVPLPSHNNKPSKKNQNAKKRSM